MQWWEVSRQFISVSRKLKKKKRKSNVTADQGVIVEAKESGGGLDQTHSVLHVLKVLGRVEQKAGGSTLDNSNNVSDNISFQSTFQYSSSWHITHSLSELTRQIA